MSDAATITPDSPVPPEAPAAPVVRQKKPIPIDRMPMRGRHWYLLCVSSMEQLIGAALSTIVGIMIPLIVLLGVPKLNPVEQGILGCAALTGIAIGSVCIGTLIDRMGYLLWFRLCPLIIAACSAGVYFSYQSSALISLFLFLIGIGVGGGYSLDSGYVSELMPASWKNFCVGLVKASCSFGFVGGALISFIILTLDPTPTVWRSLILVIGTLAVITLLLRIRWWQSPLWLMARGEKEQAQKAAKEFLGPRAEVIALPPQPAVQQPRWWEMFTGNNLKKIMLSGVTWMCEGLGVYGYGVFLPILLMMLGLQGAAEPGIPKILDSVKMTIFINLFIAVGFAIGLVILHRMNFIKLMGWSYVLSGIASIGLLVAYQFTWPVWFSLLCFMVFEATQNAGPHLVTFIIPSKIYAVRERGTGMGISAMLGKVGAMLGVFLMPILLSWGGIVAVLVLTIAVEFLGALITFYYGKKLNLL